jgi:NADPH2:quinone reductase
MTDTSSAKTALQIRSLVKSSGELELSLARIPVPAPKENEVVVRVDAAPLNPSDIGLFFGAADMTTAKASGTAEAPVVTASIPEAARKSMAARADRSMPVGNEGAGLVIAAGTAPAAQALLGKTVAFLAGGGSYGTACAVPVEMTLVLPPGATAVGGASSFVNPLTALGMVETLRREGHTALVHTAAASALGLMLNRICQKDGIPLVNVVRKAEQETILRDLGAEHVVNTSSPTFMADLTRSVTATGATLAFDALGGGPLAGQLLTAMEAALAKKAGEYSRYGTSVHKQVYIYGGLDPAPTTFTRGFGMAFGIGGWLVFPFLRKIGSEATEKLKARVAAELTTTFATRYAKQMSLAETLQMDNIHGYYRRATGEKYLVLPNRGR